MPTRKTKEKSEMAEWERQYAEFFHYAGPVDVPESESLEQPSPLRNVPSVTTIGAYEKPV